MNVLFILCDTLVRDKLGSYHGEQGPYGHIQTPNLDRLAEQSVVFQNHWINSAPCMPVRHDLWSGRIEFPWRSWGPKESFDPDRTLMMRETDITTCLFTDHANLFDVGAGNYHHFFDYYEFVRGHYNDHCEPTYKAESGRAQLAKTHYQKYNAAMDTEEKTFVQTFEVPPEHYERLGI